MTKTYKGIAYGAANIAVVLLSLYFFTSYIFTDLKYESLTDAFFIPCILFSSVVVSFFLSASPYFIGLLHCIADITARYFLCYILFLYSLKKMLGNMFSLGISTLDAPLGTTTGFALAWRFFGFNWKFDLLIALLQVVIGVLLLAKKTGFLGGLLCVAMFSFILTINVFLGIHIIVPVIVFLLLSVYVVSPVLKNIYVVLIVNKSTSPVLQHVFTVPAKTKKLAGIFGWLFIVVTTAISFYNENALRATYLNKSVLFGGWKLKPQLIEGDKDEMASIDKIYFEEADGCFIKYINAKTTPANLKLDMAKHELEIKNGKRRMIEGRYLLKNDLLVITTNGRQWIFDKLTIVDNGNYGDLYSILSKE